MENFTPKKTGLTCLGILGFIVVVWLVLSIQIVQPGKAAIVTRFGHLDNNARYEGLYVEPLASVNYYDLQTLTKESDETAGTKNLQGVNVKTTVTYKLKGDKLFEIYKTLGSEEDVIHKVIEPNVSAAVKSATTEYEAEALLISRAELTSKIKDNLGKVLEEYNIELSNVALTDISFTDADFNKSIELKQVAQQNAERAKYELQTAQTQSQAQAITAQTLTPQYLQKLYLDKWDGHLPSTLVAGDKNTSLILPSK